MAEQDPTVGALTAAGSGGINVAQNLAYGSGAGSILPPEVSGALKTLFDPERSSQMADQAYFAGMMGPTKSGSGGESMSNAITSKIAVQNKQDELRAQYIPLIMNSLVQQRQNDLGYARLRMERQKEVNPVVNSALYALQANGQPITPDDAHRAIHSIGQQYGMDPTEMYPHHDALRQAVGSDPNPEVQQRNLQNYLQSRRVQAAPAEAGINKPVTNASGQTTMVNGVTNSMQMPGAAQAQPTGGTQGLGANPTKPAVEAATGSIGDVKQYTEDLGGVVGAYKDILQRVNLINDAMKEFTPGRFAGTATSAAAIVSDLQKRFPNANLETLKKFADSLAGPGANPTAAAQIAEAVKTQEAIAQLKTSLSGAGRIGQQEFVRINNSLPGNISDPQAFQGFRNFVAGQAANAGRKYTAWSQHVAKTPPANLTVHGFDAPYEEDQLKQLLAGAHGELQPPAQQVPGQPIQPQAARPQVPGQGPARQVPSLPTAGPVSGSFQGDPVNTARTIEALPEGLPDKAGARQAFQQQYGMPPAAYLQSRTTNINLRDYEPGAKIGPTGKVYVGSGANARPARKITGRVQSGTVGQE